MDANPTKPKSLTELAYRKRRDAIRERQDKPVPIFAPMFEAQAAAALQLPGTPDIGPGGEVVRTCSAPDAFAGEVATSRNFARFAIRETLAEGADRVAEDASVRRTDLLLQPSFNALALAVDAADSIGAANSLEKMLAHHMAVAHEAALRMMDRGLSYEHGNKGDDQVEACRCVNAAVRLMGAFNDAAMTLQRLRTGGSQTVTVQHVNIEAGAQAVIGQVQTGSPTGGVKRGGNNAK